MCLLFAFLRPAHEARVAEILREALPDAFVVASHEVAAEVREFERADDRHGRRRARPADRPLPEPAAGGDRGGRAARAARDAVLAAASRRSSRPPRTRPAMLLSGPAGGAVAARIVADPPALGFDMGGTSCDTFFLAEGGAESELTVDRRVAGLPVRLPMVDIHTVSAGGGSIAWVDSGGALRVGPQSAGADPGPACYGRGGTEPTVTDANLVLGRLPAESPIAADLRLDVDAARARARVARHRVAPRRRPRASSRSRSTRWCRRCASSRSSAATTRRARR